MNLDGVPQAKKSSQEFACCVKLPDGVSVIGFGPSKRLAKRFAAENALKVLGFQATGVPPQKSSLKNQNGELESSSLDTSTSLNDGDRKVKFAIAQPESEDKQNGRNYRKRFSKMPHPASM